MNRYLNEEPLLIAAGCGLISHAIFHRYEPGSVSFLAFLLVGTSALGGVYFLKDGLPLLKASVEALKATGTYLLFLAASITTYRNSPLHPLYRFPGPWFAGTSQLWFFYQNYKGTPRLALDKAHKKYGDFVRIGPNELSINNVAAVNTIHGAKGWPKTPSYDVGLLTASPTMAEANLLSQRFHPEHSVRRKIWDRAFSSSSLAEYHPFIMKRNQELIQRLSERAGQPVDIHQWGGYFVYDMMSDLAFGGGFQLLEKGEDPVGLLPVIVLANSLHGLVDSLLWLKGLFELLPTSAAIERVFKFSRGRFEERASKGSNIKDVFSHLLGEHDEVGSLSHECLSRESQLIIGAGSDTTRTAITLGILNLLETPSVWKRLQVELDEIFQDKELNLSDLDKAPLLNAVINETLRLLPPITSGVKRESPGAVVCGRFIPPGIAVRTPNYTLSRDARYFSPGPDTFRPDRFLKPKMETAFERDAFFPFMKGPFGCIGKVVAMQELRIVIASIVMTFDGKFSPAFDIQKFNAGTKDRFVAEFDVPMEVVLTKRKGRDHKLVDMAL